MLHNQSPSAQDMIYIVTYMIHIIGDHMNIMTYDLKQKPNYTN